MRHKPTRKNTGRATFWYALAMVDTLAHFEDMLNAIRRVRHPRGLSIVAQVMIAEENQRKMEAIGVLG